MKPSKKDKVKSVHRVIGRLQCPASSRHKDLSKYSRKVKHKGRRDDSGASHLTHRIPAVPGNLRLIVP